MRTLCLLSLAASGCAGPRTTPPGETTRPAPIPPTSTSTSDSGPSPSSTKPYTMSGFSFVDEHLAGMPQPGRLVPLDQDLAFLVEQQIALLVSLTEIPTDPAAVEAAGLALVHLPIPDFTPPTLDQQFAFVRAVQERADAGEKTGVHDTAGLGRCGTMLATWFVAQGMGPAEAITEIRELRPGSIETEEQEQAVYDFAAAL